LSVEEQLDRWVEWSVDFLVANPASARITTQYMAASTPLREDPQLVRSTVAICRYAGGEIAGRLPKRNFVSEDPMLLVLLLFFGAVSVFADSPIQQELLCGSVEHDDVQRRIKRFGKGLFHKLLLED